MRETEPKRDHETRCDRQNPRSRPERTHSSAGRCSPSSLQPVCTQTSADQTQRVRHQERWVFHDARRAAAFRQAFQWARIDGVNVLRCEVLSKELGLLTPDIRKWGISSAFGDLTPDWQCMPYEERPIPAPYSNFAASLVLVKGDRIWVGYRCDMQVTPLTGKFGADVADIDISQPLSAHELSELREAFAEYSVLAIREQDLTIDSFEAFALQLGNWGTPFITPVDGHPSVLRLLREADEAGPLFGSGWHSDWSFQDQPPSATLLYGVDIPPAGGDTAFTQQEQAYDALSDGMKELLEPLHGVHSARRSYGPSGTFGQRDDRRSMEIIGDESALNAISPFDSNPS